MEYTPERKFVAGSEFHISCCAQSIALDSHEHVWLAFSTIAFFGQPATSKLAMYDGGKEQYKYEHPGTGVQQTGLVMGMAFTKQGGEEYLYLAENAGRVQRFTVSSSPTALSGAVEGDNKQGSGPGESDLPSGVAVDSATGNIYVVERGNRPSAGVFAERGTPSGNRNDW